MTALIEDTTKWILPDLAPNGKYSAKPVCEGGPGHGGSINGKVFKDFIFISVISAFFLNHHLYSNNFKIIG